MLSATHCDGGGIASWRAGVTAGQGERLHVDKGVDVAREIAEFGAATNAAATDAAIVHLRLASAGMDVVPAPALSRPADPPRHGPAGRDRLTALRARR